MNTNHDYKDHHHQHYQHYQHYQQYQHASCSVVTVSELSEQNENDNANDDLFSNPESNFAKQTNQMTMMMTLQWSILSSQVSDSIFTQHDAQRCQMNTNHDDNDDHSQWGWWWQWQWQWWWRCIDWLTLCCPGLYQVTWSLRNQVNSGKQNWINLYKWVDSACTTTWWESDENFDTSSGKEREIDFYN